MLFVKKTLVDTASWAASSDKQIDLPNEGAITRIVINLALTVTGCLAADTNCALHPWRPIQNLKIQGGGGRSYFGMSGEMMGRMLHFMNALDFPGKKFERGMATNTVYASFFMHFGSRPRDIYGRDNPFDLTAFIPAKDETNLKLTWTTTQAADVCDSAVDISAATMGVTVCEVLDLPTMRGMIPISSTEAYAHTANKSDLSAQFDVPTGGFLRRICMISQDDTAITSCGPLMAADEIAKVGLLLPKENRRLVEVDYDHLVALNSFAGEQLTTAAGAVTKPIESRQEGFMVLDLREHGHKDYGLDLRAYQTGDVKLGLTIQNYAAGDDTLIFYDTIQPYGL